MKKFLAENWQIICLFLIIALFFAKLFFPPSLFINPDYGRSDLIHFHIPIKTALAESFRVPRLPLWDPLIGQGFPIFDEGQVGALYIPNIVFFSLLPLWLAFALSYISTFTLSSLGTYLFCRSAKLPKTPSLLAALTFSFSPVFILHIHHFNLIETASLIPWVFYLTNSFLTTKKIIYLSFVPIVISQQIFSGFPQITIYGFFAFFIFLIFKLKTHIKKSSLRVKISFLTIASITLGLLMGSIQIASTYTMASESRRLNGQSTKNILTEFPLQYKNLLTVFYPYVLGTPKEGTYPPWQPGKWSIFWESNLYFGITQLILLIFYTVFLIFQKEKKGQIFFWYFLAFLGLILSLGNLAPLHPLFSIPPFSLFRVPSRFLTLSFLALAILTAYALSQINNIIKHRKVAGFFVSLLVMAATFDIFRVWYSYNPVGESKKWLQTPQILDGLPKEGRIYSEGQAKIWNQTFLKKGWMRQEDQNDFLFMKNFVGQNSNIIYGYSSVLAYGGITPRRTQIIERLLKEEIEEKDSSLTIGELSQKVFDFTSTNYFITDKKIASFNWQGKKSVEKDGIKVTVYQNKNPMPQAYAVNDYQIATTVQQVQKTLKLTEFDPRKSVILEKEINLEKSNPGQGKIEIRNYRQTKVTLEAELSTPSL
ncbi:hypothetical protein HYZ70_02835, partial [Candidatus Curtissbacteria bacterium]|nr:hypothetical protein [Candidatus Curtissbacteria bacterium]